MDFELVYVQRIREIYPDLSIETIRLNQQGQYNDVIIINNAIVFRFAKYPAAIKTLQQ